MNHKNSPLKGFEKTNTLKKSFSELSLIVFSLLTSYGQETIISDFDFPDWHFAFDRNGQASYSVENGHLLITGDLPPLSPSAVLDTFTLVSWNESVNLQDTQTIEVSLDLIQAVSTDVQTLIQIADSQNGGYAIARDSDEIWLTKFQRVNDGANAPFFYEQLSLKSQDVKLTIAITRAGDNAIITCKLVDKEESGKVLFSKTVMDTPGIDSTVDLFRNVTWYSDPGAPLFRADTIDIAILSFSDQQESDFEFLLDNFKYEIRGPAFAGIERAVRLSWPAFQTELSVEGAPSVEGPWQIVNEPVYERNGFNNMTVPSPMPEVMKVFRLSE